MEENQKKKFVCKFCNKRYPCGKALGGHIRTHMNRNSAKEEQLEANANVVKFSSLDVGKTNKRDSGSEAAAASGNPSYGLRENPKKTWRFAHSSPALLQERVCKECGKGFQSLKALCGHMACHSEKEKPISKYEDQSGSSEKLKGVMDSHSDTETSTPRQLRRSKRMRYKDFDVYPSSSVSEIEHEQEEVAMCLMMLSRDSGRRGGLNSLAESSDNNSVVLEAKSSSMDVKITLKNGTNFVSNFKELVKMKKMQRDKKLKTTEINLSDNSDSGYFRNGPKRAESDVSVDGFFSRDEFKKSGIGGFDPELEKGSNRFKFMRTKLGKEFITDEGYGEVGRALMKSGSKIRAKNDSYSPEFSEGSNKKINGFHSHRALGGHKASHKKINGCCESICESDENTIETDTFPVPKPDGKAKNPIHQNSSGNSEKRLGPKKSKGHKCPICFRVFRSGQALGGHKRSHFIGGSEENTIVIKQQQLPPEVFPGLIDLNLPAPVEEEANGDAPFMPW